MKYILLIALIVGISSFTDAEKTVWRRLTGDGLTKAGAAGMMGNLKAESGVKSVIYETAYKKKVGLSDQEYVNRVNSGAYSEYTFVHDQVGFGLAQWTYYTRKQALYNKCRGRIGDLNCQIDYLLYELRNSFSGIYSKLKSSNNIRDCAVTVLKKFENPRDQGQSVQDYRTRLATDYYNGLSGGSSGGSSGRTYTVQSGDNLTRIAKKFGTTVSAIAQLNGIKDVNKIYVGQVLRIP